MIKNGPKKIKKSSKLVKNFGQNIIISQLFQLNVEYCQTARDAKVSELTLKL